jgi:hypothetical protein
VKALLFSWSKWLVMRIRFKPQVTFPFSISSCGLLPSLLGGPATSAKPDSFEGSKFQMNDKRIRKVLSVFQPYSYDLLPGIPGAISSAYPKLKFSQKNQLFFKSL